MAQAFTYPDAPHTRRHGPRGYGDYGAYRNWLRDEFTFRCVFCLTREQWGKVKASFDIDHFKAQSLSPEKSTSYDNLLYSCRSCNCTKSDSLVPDPTQVLLSSSVFMYDDGVLEGLTDEAKRLILVMDLNGSDYVQWRRIWTRNIELAQECDLELFLQLMGFPDDLPDLGRLRPPEGNTRPEGVTESCYAKRARGELPEMY